MSGSSADLRGPKRPHEPATERQLVDRMVDAYVDWREESGLWDANQRWSGAATAEAGLAFAAYQAALDRERQAADVYATLVRPRS